MNKLEEWEKSKYKPKFTKTNEIYMRRDMKVVDDDDSVKMVRGEQSWRWWRKAWFVDNDEMVETWVDERRDVRRES